MPSLRLSSSIALAIAVLLLGGCVDRQDRGPDGGLIPNPAFPRNARIVFFGDSITEAGALPGGYVSLIESSLKALYPTRGIRVYGAGVSGNRVPDLLARLEKDVLRRKPTHVVVYIGVNDVGRGSPPGRGNTDRESYRAGLEALVRRLGASGAKVFLCTPAVIGENVTVETNENQLLDQYSEVSREVAAEHGAVLCDLRAAFVDYLRENNVEHHDRGVLTSDGVHLNEEGNQFVARHILSTLASSERPAPASP
ncbi:MAG: SGNH/GDSL hydrolase family protein [Actinomycetota bacterium]|nr:SGNH/GDSL hydrolase family protein [Actinomycetota bacterium]